MVQGTKIKLPRREKLTKKGLARALRDLALDYETGFFFGYTCCNLTSVIYRKYGDEAAFMVRSAYETTFGFGDSTFEPSLSTANEHELWDMDFHDYMGATDDMRVMMLCFAAALAETGDLL